MDKNKNNHIKISTGFGTIIFAMFLYAVPVMADSGSGSSGIDGGIIAAIVAGVLFALVICLALKGKMKTARPKKEAGDYMVGGIQLTDRRDIYTHTTETRVRIQRENKSK